MHLTERQKQILSLAANGMLAKECAHALGVTVRTVEAHRVQAIVALGARNTVHAVAIAIRRGIIPLAAGVALGALCFTPGLNIVSGNARSTGDAMPMQAQCWDEPFHLHPHDARFCKDADDQPGRRYY